VPAASNDAEFQGKSIHPATAAVRTPIKDEISTERGSSPAALPPAYPQPSAAEACTVNDKPDLKLIEATASDDPYDLSRLRINPETLETTGVKKLLTTVPVRKPLPKHFVRVRPEPHYRETFAFIEFEREIYIVDLGAVPELQRECFFATLFVAISRNGVLFVWPVKVPPPDGKILEWHTSAAMAAQAAMKRWVRVESNMDLGAYEIYEAAGSIPDPTWPDLSFKEIHRIAFKDKIIRDRDHPVVKRLRGE
jgi:hypothetical protein